MKSQCRSMSELLTKGRLNRFLKAAQYLERSSLTMYIYKNSMRNGDGVCSTMTPVTRVEGSFRTVELKT